MKKRASIAGLMVVSFVLGMAVLPLQRADAQVCPNCPNGQPVYSSTPGMSASVTANPTLIKAHGTSSLSATNTADAEKGSRDVDSWACSDENPKNWRATLYDSITWTWSGSGTFNPSSEQSTQWTAPCTGGNYILTCTLSDSGTGDRDDSDASGSASVTVLAAGAISGPTSVCADVWATYSADTNPSGYNHKDWLHWSGGDGLEEEPSEGNGYVYRVKWNTGGNKTVSVWVADNHCDIQNINVVVNAPPQINIVKPSCDNEYVANSDVPPYAVFIKAYITDPENAGISWAKFYVDGTYKGYMQQESGYWYFDWDASGTSKGTHTIKVEAEDAGGCIADKTRPVFANPEVYLEEISFQNGHTLWQRQGPDEEITPPQWKPTYTQPFAYTIGSQMTVNVGMDSDDVTGSVYIAYSVGGTWKNTDEETKGTYNIDKDSSGTFPCSLAHYPTAPAWVMDYHLYQSYHFYVRKCQGSDWCPAGSANVTHPQIYLTFGAPIGPWGTTGEPRACWTCVINLACSYMPETGYGSAQSLDAKKRLAQMAYWYIYKNYTSLDTHCVGSSFNMHDFLLLHSWGDCQDMSSWWVKLCNSVGLNGQVRRIKGDFTTKNISAISNGSWSWSVQGWAFHQVGWYSNVFDPCLRVKQSAPRVPQDEDIADPYKTDLFDSGDDWTPQTPFSLSEAY